MCTLVAGCNREDSSAKLDTCGPCRASLHRLHKKRSSQVTEYFDRARMMVGRAHLIGDFDKAGEELVGFVNYETLQDQRVMMPPRGHKRRARSARVTRVRRTAKAIAVAAKLRDRKRKGAETSKEAHA